MTEKEGTMLCFDAADHDEQISRSCVLETNRQTFHPCVHLISAVQKPLVLMIWHFPSTERHFNFHKMD